VLVAAQGKSIPTLSIIMLAAIYGLQALIFLFRGKWDMIGWMIFYILAIPIFSFLLPLMSFWAMDDFSWGSTRLIQGEGGKKLIQHVGPTLHSLPVELLLTYDLSYLSPDRRTL
jgi:chitin synthase